MVNAQIEKCIVGKGAQDAHTGGDEIIPKPVGLQLFEIAVYQIDDQQKHSSYSGADCQYLHCSKGME